MKTKLFITSICLIVLYSLSAQQKNHSKTSTPIFLDIDYTGIIEIYDKPGGKCIQKLAHDFEEDIFVLFDIIDKNDSMFYVLAYYSLEDRPEKYMGWIKKERYLGIYSRNYNVPLHLYEAPNNKSKIIFSTNDIIIHMHTVIDRKDDWLKIELTHKNKTYQGWITPEMQCANVYSTCN